MKKSNTVKPKKAAPAKEKKQKKFPVVAIGASAGGLEAASIFFKHLPEDTGMAYIYVQHLSQDHKSFLTSILGKTTKMKVQVIEEMEHMEPNNVYVIPYNKGIKVTNGHIRLIPREKGGAPITIDVLFSSLAITHEKNVIGILLSGNGHDGAVGLRDIQRAGGLTIAQDETARYQSMPQSAINNKAADFILSPEEAAFKLSTLEKNGTFIHPFKRKQEKDVIDDNDPEIKTIFKTLHKTKGVDFSHYKMATVKRRLHNRMNQCAIPNLSDYSQYLVKTNKESDLLYKDLLINVTCFFRDTEVFRYLKSTILPKLLKKKQPGDSLRIWIPACSTGQEAYSLAMLIAELQATKSRKIPIQIFATDLSDAAIHQARIGEYAQADLEDISKVRLKKFFHKAGDSYRIIKEIRESCVFAPHNILQDPPFSRMDLITCCNLLIYFDAAAQKKVLATFHFGLADGGYLMLGKSETTGTGSQLFAQVNNKFKIYSRKKNAGPRKIPELVPKYPGSVSGIQQKKPLSVFKKVVNIDSTELDSVIDATLLSRFMPACAIINKEMEIIQFRGSTSLYLTHGSGKASLNIMKMMRPEFAFELRSAIHKAIKTKHPVVKTDIEMNMGPVARLMSLEVSPVNIEWEEPLFMIVFTLQEQVENLNGKIQSPHKTAAQKDRRIKKLAEELNSARLEMQGVIESQEADYEKLQAANEEIVSTSEEFQTLNEELETSKEETEATNEELISTNQELKMQNELLAESYDYAQTITDTIHEPMIILDSHLQIKSANKSFYKKFNISKENAEGVPFFELNNNQWDIPELHNLLENIISRNLHFENFEVTHEFPGIGKRVMLLNANRIIQKTHREKLILLAIEDITERAMQQKKEKELLKTNIRLHEEDKRELERAVNRRTRQLTKKNAELERANKDLTTFTYVSSHDLQEPLRKLQNFVAYIEKKDAKLLSPEGKSHFKKIQETSKRMQLLIEDLLSYSRAKNARPEFEKTDLKLMMEEVLLNFKEPILAKKAKIKMKLGMLNVIPAQFRQVLQNLVGNSLKFSRPHIPLLISIKSAMIKGNSLHHTSLSPKYNYCHIAYTDNGIGFDQQYHERIFEVFQRLHSYEDYKGTGIGLAICKRIIDNHHGVITATGKLNKGARFDIYLPV